MQSHGFGNLTNRKLPGSRAAEFHSPPLSEARPQLAARKRKRRKAFWRHKVLTVWPEGQRENNNPPAHKTLSFSINLFSRSATPETIRSRSAS
jgi:hypothetical protein